MPRIVPLQLLKCLRVLLDNNGGILSPLEVKRIAGLMAKYSKKLVSKCVYVQILKSTKTELLGDFMSVGGWSLVYTWLNDAIRAMNWPLVQEILELLLLSPVDVTRLKINSAPVLVKSLCKDGGNEGVRILAKRLVEQWLKIVTENPGGSAGPTAYATGGHQIHIGGTSADSTIVDDNTSGSMDSRQAHFMEHNSSDSTDSGGGSSKPNYTVTSALKSHRVVLKLKTVDRSAAASAESDEDNSLPASEAGVEDGDEANTDKSIVEDDSADAKARDDSDKKHKSSRDKSKKSDKDRDKDRKSSSYRSSSSSHKSSSSSSSKSSSKSSSSSHRSSSEKHRDKDKARSSSSKDKGRKDGTSSSSSSSKHKPSSKSSSSTSSSSSSSKDRSRDKDKEKVSSSNSKKDERSEHDKDNKLMPPPAAVSADKKGSDIPKPKSISIPSRKASISIEIRRDTDKMPTVKTYQSKFRSHGLTEEAPPPPSRKDLKKPSSSTTTGTPGLLSTPPLKRPSPPRDSPTDKKAKIDINNVSGHVERPGAVKLIAPKKIQTLVETNLFSDALTASIEPKKMVKRKRPQSVTSPTEKETPLAPLKFYQDTLDESKNEYKSDDNTKENEHNRTSSPTKDGDGDDDDIPLKKVKEDIEQKVRKEKAEGDDAETGSNHSAADSEDMGPEEPKKPGPGCGPDGPPGVLMLHRRKGPKKKLTWQTEEKLTQIRYFEVDHSERVNVTKQTFLEMKNMERYSERDALNIARRGFDDIMEPQIEWRPLIEVDNVPDHPNGNLSKQRTVQAEREATTLRALYFSPDMIPDSPAEAELEPHFQHDIPVIPMDDLTGNPDAVNDFSSVPWPEPKGFAPNSAEMNFADSISNLMMPGMAPNMMPGNPFQPFGNNFIPNGANLPPNQPLPMNMPGGGQQIWQNRMPHAHAPPMMHGGNVPPNFIGGQFGNTPPPFGPPVPPSFNNMNFPPMMMGGPGGVPVPMQGPNPGMMNGGPMPNGMGPIPNGGPRNNNNNNRNKNGGNWRSGGNNFQENSGGNWRSAGSGSNRGGGVGGGNNNSGICKQFMRGHCHMGKACKYVHPQKKRM